MKSDLRFARNVLLCCLLLSVACNQKKAPKISDTQLLHQNEFLLTEVIIYDVFTPPVASRIYAYSSLASYEAIRYSNPSATSIAEKLRGFTKMPEPEKEIPLMVEVNTV